MLVRKILFVLLGAASVSLGACTAASGDDDAPLGSGDDEVKVDTRAPAARRQYDANVAFASSYRPTCAKTSSGRPRVMVTGFGRFMSINDNATGRIVSKLVPGSVYPETVSPPADAVDPPGPQLNVVSATVDLPQSGLVDVCAMILPANRIDARSQ